MQKLEAQFQEQNSLFQTESKALCLEGCLETEGNNSLAQNSWVKLDQTLREISSGKEKSSLNLKENFKKKLRKRVKGQIQAKLAENQRLRACLKGKEGDRNWFQKNIPQVDWSLMKEVCKKNKKSLRASIQKHLPEMRKHLVLSQVNPDQIVTGRPYLAFPLKHELSSFGSIPKLTEKEQAKVKEHWANQVKKIPSKMNPDQFEMAFLKGDGELLGKNLHTEDMRNLKRATWKMQKESRDRYRQILEEMPLLAFLKTDDLESPKEWDKAFSKMEKNLENLLKEAEKGDMVFLLSFKPLVEELIQESKGGYCLTAEREREKAENQKNAKAWRMAGLGILAALPCFMSGPGATLCLTAGLALSGTGYVLAKREVKTSSGRTLMGKDFETIAELVEKDKNRIWELMLLPTSVFAVAAPIFKGGKVLLNSKKLPQNKKGPLQSPQKAPTYRKKISSEDLKLPPATHKAQALKEKGFGSAWSKGIDELEEWTAVKKQLQALKADPRKTHIQYFADQIEDHIAFVEQGLDPTDKSKKKFLEVFRKQAKKAISEERVTYEWWMKFNFRIMALLSDTFDILEMNTYFRANEDLISQFPSRMALPTTKGEMGIITLNRAQKEGISPLGLISKSKKVDGQIKDPAQFFTHDIDHVIRQSKTVKEQHKKMQVLMENLPTDKRKRAELVYFTATHEVPESLPFLSNSKTREEVAKSLTRSFYDSLINGVFSEKMAGLGKKFSEMKSSDKMEYIRDSIIEDFMREIYDSSL